MPNTITKKSLVETIADNTGQRRVDVKRTLQELLDQIVTELGEGNRIEFRDFGVFEVKQRASRTAQNPRTLERVAVPAKRTVKFKPGRKMKDVLDSITEPPSDMGGQQPAPVGTPPRGDSSPAVIGTIEHSTNGRSRATGNTPKRGETPEVHVTNHTFVHAGQPQS